MVYVTGDCHADFRKFSSSFFPEGKKLTRDDYVIVCGDFGGIWYDSGEERWWLNWLEEKPFTILFVDGNHENFDRLSKFEEINFLGGRAHKIRSNIYHLMRGYVFTIENKKFFAFGGASSHDVDDGILDPNDFDNEESFFKTCYEWRRQRKMFRINHLSWWKEELPSQDEMNFGLKTLAENNNKVDYIITHCCPQEIASVFSCGSYKPDVLTTYFNEIAHKVSFDKWFFGHYHDDKKIYNKYNMLYYGIERII